MTSTPYALLLAFLQARHKALRVVKNIYKIFWFEKKKKFDAVQELSHPLIFQRLFQSAFF